MFSIQTTSSEVKKILGGYATPLLFGAMLSVFALAFWYGVTGWKEFRSIRETQQISVTGEGKVAVKPDIAMLSVSIVTEAKKIKDAQLDNTRLSGSVTGFLKEMGIEEKDIKSVNYSIYPQYNYYDAPVCMAYPCPPHRPPEVVSYQVRHSLEIKVRNLDDVDDLLDGVVTAGATEVGSVSFTVDDEKKVLADARKKAIEDAKAKAAVLSKDLGVRLGKIVGFSESGGPFPVYMRTLEAVGKGGGFGGDMVPASSVQPGEQEVVSTVTITYEFR